MQQLIQLWQEFDAATRVIIAVFLVSVLVVIAIYIIQKVRGVYSDDPSQYDNWSTLGEMREDGTLREYEYQHLRKHMAGQIAEETEEKASKLELDIPAKPPAEEIAAQEKSDSK